MLLFAQQYHTAGLGLKLVEVVTRLLMFFKHLRGNLAVNFGAGQLFQQLGALFRFGVEEGGKLAL